MSAQHRIYKGQSQEMKNTKYQSNRNNIYNLHAIYCIDIPNGFFFSKSDMHQNTT